MGERAESACAAAKADGYSFYFDTTDPSKEYMVENTLQDDCPMFHQAMLVLGAHRFSASVSDKLRDVFVYVDFSGIFDRRPMGRVLEQQRIAEHMFRPEGITLNFGGADHRYIAFERSASMSRENRLSFVREDVYESLKERMMLGMDIRSCQLSKLYAYNALLFTSGMRYDDTELLSEKKIIVIENPRSAVRDVDIVTVEDDGTDNPMRTYTRVARTADIEIMEFDGEGLISPSLAKKLDREHSSFQIRMPYIKGVVHKVDYAGLLSELGVSYITDLWGNRHDPREVDIILTESMFKGLGWMKENGLTWADYLERCRKYGHALYVSGKDKLTKQVATELNYQFLNTLAMTDEEFRPRDLPLGWACSPKEDKRQWITKTTEAAYFDLVADESARRGYFLDKLDDKEYSEDMRGRYRLELVRRNPLFMNEPTYAKELNDKAQSVLSKYAMGRLLIAGDNRYLSDDLMRLLLHIVDTSTGKGEAYERLEKECLMGNTVYAPNPGYEQSESYTLLRSPHIARNEEVIVKPLEQPGCLREKYLSHLGYVVMVDSRSLIPERLGGADFDGDMVKTIADPLLNACVKRSSAKLPLLKIPAAQPLIADANDWYERFRTVKSTFSSRVGQISNAALSRGILAYDENTDAEDKERYDREVETLAILTGLEIDSAKSGVKPDLSEYLKKQSARRSIFLRYKDIADSGAEHKWYEPSKNARLKKYFEAVDWQAVSSNLERLPYYAYMLERETAKVQVPPAEDEKLFVFAKAPDWKTQLDKTMLTRVASLISDYETAFKRVRYVRHISMDMKRRNDIYRILFARGQENDYTVEELYAAFDNLSPRQIRQARLRLNEAKWPFTPLEEREETLYHIAGMARIFPYIALFCDFRNSGYRVLGDVICDLDDMYRNTGVQKHFDRQKGDSDNLKKLLNGVRDGADYKQRIISNCMNIIMPPDKRNALDYVEVVKCAVALGKRQFAIEVLAVSDDAEKQRGRTR